MIKLVRYYNSDKKRMSESLTRSLLLMHRYNINHNHPLLYRSSHNIVMSINALKTDVSLTSMILTIRRKIDQPGLVYL